MSAVYRIVGLGEILWDVFADGPRFGGAPANFACSAAGLSGPAADVLLVSSVGNDDLGDEALETLHQRGVDTTYVARQELPTGTVTVDVNDRGHASYTFASDTAWDHLPWSAELQQLASRADAVCFGTLGQRSDSSRQSIQAFVAAVPASAYRVFDINLRAPHFQEQTVMESLGLANVLKLNDEELPWLVRLCSLHGSSLEMLRELQRRFQLRAVALTRGSEGAVLLRGDESSEYAGVPTSVADTVGAGDAFTAAFTLGLLRYQPLAEINRQACRIAAHVCSQHGGTPDLTGQ